MSREENSSEDGFRVTLRWPRKGDHPFKAARHWEENAWIGGNKNQRTYLIMEGYRKGADLMVGEALGDRAQRDFLVYPIIFSYRQYIEIALKDLISNYGPHVGFKAVWNTHDLNVLWRTFHEVFMAYGIDDDETMTDAARNIVGEFAKVDPRSFSFRYAVDKKGAEISLAHEHLDLSTLADVMEGLELFLSATGDYMDHLKYAGP